MHRNRRWAAFPLKRGRAAAAEVKTERVARDFTAAPAGSVRIEHRGAPRPNPHPDQNHNINLTIPQPIPEPNPSPEPPRGSCLPSRTQLPLVPRLPLVSFQGLQETPTLSSPSPSPPPQATSRSYERASSRTRLHTLTQPLTQPLTVALTPTHPYPHPS